MTFVHLRRARQTVANSPDVGLLVQNRSIHKPHALPPGDSGYTVLGFIHVHLRVQ